MNENGADVWFVFNDERIPGHRLILAASPWLDNMFFGSLTENGDVNMNNSNVSSTTFKEFLRYIYTGKANLTMDNISEMIFLADESLCEEFFGECENFLIKNLNVDNIFVVYQLALQHERAARLKVACEEEICINAASTLKSSNFSQIQFDFLQNIVKCDSLVCEEKDVFNACIGWAKAACRRNRIDQHNPLNLRAQLGDLLYQIRFSSMTSNDAATCINSCPGLFTADELQEIMCIVGRTSYSGTIHFNSTPRYFSIQRNTDAELKCNRFNGLIGQVQSHENHLFSIIETTEFTCNRPATLKGFTCECNEPANKTVNLSIVEMRAEEDAYIRCSEQKILRFSHQHLRRVRRGETVVQDRSFEAKIMLNQGILLRPGYVYQINIAFGTEPRNLKHKCHLKTKVRVDHDIVIRFKKTNEIVTSLILCRFDNRKFIQKIFHNPMTWFLLILALFVIILFILYVIKLFGKL